MTVLFQTPVHYNDTIKENIFYGDAHSDRDKIKLNLAAANAGADTVAEKQPQKYEQLLGHYFSKGTELSGGEWQRIALARAFYRQSNVILLASRRAKVPVGGNRLAEQIYRVCKRQNRFDYHAPFHDGDAG